MILKLQILENKPLSLRLFNNKKLRMELIDTAVDSGEVFERYTGEYEVIPDIEAQTLYTSNKLMQDNVTVQEIPYHEVSNIANGTTVIIGGTEYYGIQ